MLKRRETIQPARCYVEKIFIQHPGEVIRHPHLLTEQVDGRQFRREGRHINPPQLAQLLAVVMQPQGSALAVISADQKSARAASRVHHGIVGIAHAKSDD